MTNGVTQRLIGGESDTIFLDQSQKEAKLTQEIPDFVRHSIYNRASVQLFICKVKLVFFVYIWKKIITLLFNPLTPKIVNSPLLAATQFLVINLQEFGVR